jgi:uncharacterized membrane protein
MRSDSETLPNAPLAPATLTPAIRPGARRVIFVDLARALAVALMVQGHTLDALLDRAYQSEPWYGAWLFQRGLTSCVFLMLSGFAFSVATTRRWSSHTRLSWTAVSRIRRFGFFVLLGYALHFPASRFSTLSAAGDEAWRSFLAVDVLQLIGVSLILLQVLVLLCRTPRMFGAAAFAGCAILAAATPLAWAADWPARLPQWIAAYLSPAAGSLFPLIPWTAYVLLGAGLGQIYNRWGAAHLGMFANRFLLGAGAAMVVAAIVFARLPLEPFGPTDFWSTSPNLFLLRAGAVLVGLGVIAHFSRRLAHLPHIFAAMAQESLLVYFVHLCIVYGSVWNLGLGAYVGVSLSLGRIALVVAGLVGCMTALAWGWNWCKHAHGRVARLVTYAVLAYLVWYLT